MVSHFSILRTGSNRRCTFDEQLEALFYNYQTVAIMLILFGVAFIVIENYHKGKKAKVNTLVGIDYKLAFWIGMFQLIAAIFPGTSRSGATIVGALLLEFPELLQRNIHFSLQSRLCLEPVF